MPVSKDDWKMIVRMGEISSANSFRIVAVIVIVWIKVKFKIQKVPPTLVMYHYVDSVNGLQVIYKRTDQCTTCKILQKYARTGLGAQIWKINYPVLNQNRGEEYY